MLRILQIGHCNFSISFFRLPGANDDNSSDYAVNLGARQSEDANDVEAKRYYTLHLEKFGRVDRVRPLQVLANGGLKLKRVFPFPSLPLDAALPVGSGWRHGRFR